MKSAKVFVFFTFLFVFASCVSAQEIPFPNELKGYEFYNQGKLKGIKVKTSNKQDVKAVFGDDCEAKHCEYNEDWEVSFFYYLEGWPKRKIVDGFEQIYIISPEYVNRLFAIQLYPKKTISFNQISFPKKFHSEPWFGEHSVKFKYYTDSNGLFYTLIDEDGSYKGNLRDIQYSVPENFEQDMFNLIQIQNNPLSDQ